MSSYLHDLQLFGQTKHLLLSEIKVLEKQRVQTGVELSDRKQYSHPSPQDWHCLLESIV